MPFPARKSTGLGRPFEGKNCGSSASCEEARFPQGKICRGLSGRESGLMRANLSMHPASYWKPVGSGKVQCLLCPNRCVIPLEGRGKCRVRANYNGKLYLLVYGRPCVVKVEPIEKQTFLHFLPGSKCLALGTAGCNLSCLYCQNWQFTMAMPEQVKSFNLSPQEVVSLAQRYRLPTISFTFNDPVVIAEYVLDTAKIARRYGIRTVLVTGGYINPEPLKDLCKVVDAIKVDLKGFDDRFYREVVGGERDYVLQALKIVRSEGVWLEVVNLVIPNRNDRPSQVAALCEWVRANLGRDTPLIFSRFWPNYKLKHLPPTPASTLERCRAIGYKAGLRFVYIGNVPGHPGQHTYCPRCKRIAIKRAGFSVKEIHLKNGECAYCGYPIPGVWA